MADATPTQSMRADEVMAPSVDAAPANPRSQRLTILAAVIVIAALGWGVWYLLTQMGREYTDNAYVGADSAQVTPLISGAVADVRVSGAQAVKKGDILVTLDDADAKIDVATAQAALLQAQQHFVQSQALVGSAAAKFDARAADIAQARARLAQAQAGYVRAQVDLSRREALVASGAVSKEELSSAQAAFAAAKADRELAQAGVATAAATRTSARSDVNASEALVRGTTLATSPDVAAARARLDEAELDLSRTIVRAPVDGIVANRQVQIGQRLAAGTPIMTIVPISAAYVDANFKESQFKNVRIGQPVELTSDYYGSGVVFHGRVTGLAGGTGAAFSLIPAQNATGNWIKVVQRLPVRVALDPAELRQHPLRVGLSMDATIDTRSK